jgi:type II secretory pathway pseudopilin PulG
MRPLLKSPLPRRAQAAFSLLELLVSMGLLSVIVLALFSMFDQTQKALHSAIAQTDVMEPGRSAMDLLTRDLERGRATRFAGVTNLLIRRLDRNGPYFIPGVLDGNHRDSALHELFYVSPLKGLQWTAQGWFVADDVDPSQPPDSTRLGSLYRFESTNVAVLRGTKVTNDFNRQWIEFIHRSTNAPQFGRFIDGVVFFRATAFSGNGLPLDSWVFPKDIPAGVVITNLSSSISLTGFTNQALPTALEVEFGVLPPKLLTQYRALPSGNPVNAASFRSNFFVKYRGDVQVFRQRISLSSAIQ